MTIPPRRQEVSPPPLTLHDALRRALFTAKVPGSLATALVADAETAAAIAARVAEPFIEEVRAGERARCAALLRGLAAGARRNGEAVAAVAMARLANEIDPLGPVMGAPASGGTM